MTDIASGPSPGAAVVIGGGTMGAGIAQCLLEAGAAVVLTESSEAQADAARARVADGLRRRFKGDADPAGCVAEHLARLQARPGMADDPEAVLVIEAVPEEPALKARILAAADRAFPGAEVVATNTSSLSVDGLAAAVERPERFLGLHFFNPVPRSELVEIVVGAGTAAVAVTAAQRWVERLGKRSIEVRDSPGFATSRLGVAIGLEAIRMLEEGVASAEDLDLGMVLGYKFPVGPLRLTDLVGLDVRLAIAEHLAGELGPRFEPPKLLRDKVAAGELGKKTGRGFYRWD
ncbi:MAG: 3-hydroxyacyl-CoA dehydrogenase family protein [Acidimicrobiia bacterium]